MTKREELKAQLENDECSLVVLEERRSHWGSQADYCRAVSYACAKCASVFLDAWSTLGIEDELVDHAERNLTDAVALWRAL